MHMHMMMGGDTVVLFEMGRAHDGTAFHVEAAARPSPRSLWFQGELRSSCLRRLVLVEQWWYQ